MAGAVGDPVGYPVGDPVTTGTPSVTRVAVLLGTLVALTIVGSSAVAVALPAVGRELGLDTAGRAWVLAAFSLPFSVTTALFGRIADLRGLRLPLRVGITLFAAGALVAALAPTFGVLVAGRLVMGAGAGAVPVLSVAVVTARFDDEHRLRALAGLTGVVSLVSGSGPLIGGAITQAVGWRAVLAVPVLSLALLRPVARLAPPTAPQAASREGAPEGNVDVRGAGLVAVAVTGLVLLLQAPSTGVGPAAAAAAATLAVAAGAALARHTRGTPDGFLPRALVGDRVLVRSAAAGFTVFAAYLAMLFAVPQLLDQRQGWPPLTIGAALLPAAALGALTSRVVGAHAARLGHLRVVAALAVGSAAGLLLCAVGASSPVLPVVGFALAASGFSGGQVALTDVVPRRAPASARGAALGVFNLIFFVGGAVGAAAGGGLAGPLTLPGALAAIAVLPLLGAACALAADRASRRDPPLPDPPLLDPASPGPARPDAPAATPPR